MSLQKYAVPIIVLIIVIAGTALLTSSNMQPTRPAKEAIKIGFIGPLSGELASWGSSMQGGVKLAADELSKTGSTKLDIIYEDDQCDKTRSVNAMRKLIDVDRVKLIIGPLCSGTVLADAPIAEQNKVILLGFGSAAAISEAGDYVFRPSYSDAYQGEFLGSEITEKFKKMGILYVNNDYGTGLLNGFKKSFISNGGMIGAEDTYSFEDRDWRAQLTKIKSSGPSAVLLITYGREGGLIAKQARELGINVQIVGTDNFGTRDVIEAGGESVEGAVFTFPAPLDETNTAVKDFKNKYIELNGKEPPILFVAANAYDATKVSAQALSAAGNDGEKIKTFLYAMPPYNGISGIMKFDANGDASKEFVFQTIKDGKFEVISLEDVIA